MTLWVRNVVFSPSRDVGLAPHSDRSGHLPGRLKRAKGGHCPLTTVCTTEIASPRKAL